MIDRLERTRLRIRQKDDCLQETVICNRETVICLTDTNPYFLSKRLLCAGVSYHVADEGRMVHFGAIILDAAAVLRENLMMMSLRENLMNEAGGGEIVLA